MRSRVLYFGYATMRALRAVLRIRKKGPAKLSVHTTPNSQAMLDCNVRTNTFPVAFHMLMYKGKPCSSHVKVTGTANAAHQMQVTDCQTLIKVASKERKFPEACLWIPLNQAKDNNT
jgi:hypothetical protein